VVTTKPPKNRPPRQNWGKIKHTLRGDDEEALLRVRIVDMSTSNAWAEFADVFIRTQDAHLEHEKAKAELKRLVPEDAQQAIGHGVRAKRSKSGGISFDLLKAEQGDAAIQ
jgi:hypothetical protein